MSVKDRTSEFHAAVESVKSWTTKGHGFRERNNLEQKYPLVGGKGRTINGSSGHVGISKTEFSRMASAIGKDINATAAKLQKLTKRKFLFKKFSFTFLFI